jgi:iron complex outermembrane receptor protein
MGFFVYVKVKPMNRRLQYYCYVLLLAMLPAINAEAQIGDPEDLKQLSLEELMDLNVTSVSRRPERLTEAASAIQVITNEEIRRSGARTIPEALRLAPNLQVAQLNASQWIISARGFNAVFANKLLVMIDGRTVYSPLFAGVFWDVQNVLLEDVERIEVISGPGGIAWGANAVNGVINIITRNASDAQGGYVSGSLDRFGRHQVGLRYGGQLGDDFYYRFYALSFARNHTYLEEADNNDAWYFGQSGLSLEWRPSETDHVLVHGKFYMGTHDNVPAASKVDGQNIMARWTGNFSEKSTMVVQAYYDRTWRKDTPSTISDQVSTFDLDVDHSLRLSNHVSMLWGLGYRFIRNDTYNATSFYGMVPKSRDMPLYSTFVQGEVSMADDHLRLIVGSKLQHNVFSDFEFQPSVRLAWIKDTYTLWGAVSRAVRAPSRIDVDNRIPVDPLPPELPSVAGGPNFDSEKVVAYELGYRYQPVSQASLSISTFYNEYDDLYSVEPLPGTLTYQIQNGTKGTSRGVEVFGRFAVSDWWRLRAGYTYFEKDLENKPGHFYDYSDLGYDAENRVMLHSMADLPANLQFDLTFRYIDPLPKVDVPDYFTMDARLAWVNKRWELAVVGQNLWEDRHREYVAWIPRTFYGIITCRF